MNPREVLLNIIKTPLLRHFMAGCLAIAIVIILYSRFFVTPGFSEFYMKDLEKEAIRAGRYLAATIFSDRKDQQPPSPDEPAGTYAQLPFSNINKEMFSRDVLARIEEARYHLQIEKIKVFDPSGEIVFSTDRKDIGGVNQKPYFTNKIAKGEVVSFIVQKDAKSLEGQTYQRDVAEIYVPFMVKSSFLGAFEIYYDVSEARKDLAGLVSLSLTILYVFTSLFILLVTALLYRGSIQIIRQRMLDAQLQEAKKQLEIKVKEQTEEIRETQAISIAALSVMAEYYDDDTGAHLYRIQSYVEMLVVWLKENSVYGEYLESRPDYIEEIKLACLLHDVGKTAISKDILNKPGKLSHEEFEIMKRHTRIAGDALYRANENFRQKFNTDSYLALARDIALYHHEKWNGEGYPEGKSGESIPLSARIVALVDVYDALRNKRPYKEPWTHQEAYAEIIKGKSVHFDPHVIDAFISLADKFEEVFTTYNENTVNEHQRQDRSASAAAH